jgi:peptidoglycan/xylan/chitin deacetylase (PgdA/CDA1 family)
MSPPIPILMYHQISPWGPSAFRKYVVSPRAFAAQIRWLALAGYQSVALETAVGPRTTLPRRPVIVTFDDGFRDCAEYAPPILQRWGFGAVFFLVAGHMGGTSRWLVQERGVELPLMDWPTARRLQADGFVCASHTLSHPRLAQLSVAACRRELHDSRARLEDELGREARHLAYPFGSFDDRVRAVAAEAGYRSACSVMIGLSTSTDDPLALRRVPVNGQDSLVDFAWRLRTARTAAEWLRGRLAAVRRGIGRAAPA